MWLKISLVCSCWPFWPRCSVCGQQMLFSVSVCVCVCWSLSSQPGQLGSWALHLFGLPGDAAELKECVNTAQFVMKSCRAFSSAAAILFIPAALLLRLNGANKHQQIFHPKAQEKHRHSGSRMLIKTQARESPHTFQLLIMECFFFFCFNRTFPGRIFRDTKEFSEPHFFPAVVNKSQWTYPRMDIMLQQY